MVSPPGPQDSAGPTLWQDWGRSPVPPEAFLARLAQTEARVRDEETVRQAALRLSAVERDLDRALDWLVQERRRAERAAAELAQSRQQAAEQAEAAAALSATRLAEVAAQIAAAEQRAASAEQQLQRVTGSRTWRARAVVAAVVRLVRA